MPEFTLTIEVSDRQLFVFDYLRNQGIGTTPIEGQPTEPLERKEFLEYILYSWLNRKWQMLREEAEKTLTDDQIQDIIEGMGTP